MAFALLEPLWQEADAGRTGQCRPLWPRYTTGRLITTAPGFAGELSSQLDLRRTCDEEVTQVTQRQGPELLGLGETHPSRLGASESFPTVSRSGRAWP